MTAFAHEPPRDFSKPEHVRAMGHAIGSVAEQLDQAYPNLIGGERVPPAPGAPVLRTTAAGRPGEVISRFADAPAAAPGEPDGARAGVRALHFAAAEASAVARVPAGARRERLAHAAQALRTRRSEFAAWLCFEAGLEWREADEEVAAAIDFFRAHAEGVLPGGRVPWPAGTGESPLPDDPAAVVVAGDAALPLAGPAAALAAAFAAGRPVVFVPAPETATIGWKLAELLADAAGLDDAPGALQFVTATRVEDGLGEDAPDAVWLRRPASERTAVVVHASAWPEDRAPGEIVRAAFARGGRRPWAPGTVYAAGPLAGDVAAVLRRAAGALVQGPAIDAVTDRAEVWPAPVVREEGPPPREHELVVRAAGEQDAPWSAVVSDGEADAAGAGPVWVLCADDAAEKRARTLLGARARLNRVRAPLSFEPW